VRPQAACGGGPVWGFPCVIGRGWVEAEGKGAITVAPGFRCATSKSSLGKEDQQNCQSGWLRREQRWSKVWLVPANCHGTLGKAAPGCFGGKVKS
jgi:hypothetical protein